MPKIKSNVSDICPYNIIIDKVMSIMSETQQTELPGHEWAKALKLEGTGEISHLVAKPLVWDVYLKVENEHSVKYLPDPVIRFEVHPGPGDSVEWAPLFTLPLDPVVFN